jgi:uncharacterized DUF497 family protein
MKFEWDENKNRQNLKKHGINFEMARLVFGDPHLVGRVERIQDDEERWQTIGIATGIALLLVAHARVELDGAETIRMISARTATKAERRSYEERARSPQKDFQEDGARIASVGREGRRSN